MEETCQEKLGLAKNFLKQKHGLYAVFISPADYSLLYEQIYKESFRKIFSTSFSKMSQQKTLENTFDWHRYEYLLRQLLLQILEIASAEISSELTDSTA